MKPSPVQRETFIALRARRTGHRVAREILNPPVPVAQRSIHCAECGAEVPVENPSGEVAVVACPACHRLTELRPELPPAVRSVEDQSRRRIMSRDDLLMLRVLAITLAQLMVFAVLMVVCTYLFG